MTDLRAIGWPWVDGVGDPAWRALMQAHLGARPARVVEQHRSGYVVAESPVDGYHPQSLPEWQRPPRYEDGEASAEQRAAVGDWVLVEGVGESARIVALLPRRSAIKRAAAGEHYRQQVIAANVDTVFVVSGLDGDFNPRRIERYLLLIAGTGAQPVLVLTKADRPDADVAAVRAALSGLVTQDLPMVALDARDPDAVRALRPWLQPGMTAVLVGSSGAGKSTLTNALLGRAKMKTGAVRDSDDRGRHTTTHRSLIALPGGACLIDTPGMRELKPTGEEDPGESFADIEALTADCRFRDCRHAREPGCAVRAALERGELDAQRMSNYLKLTGEVADAAERLAARLAERNEARARPRPSGKRPDSRRGRD